MSDSSKDALSQFETGFFEKAPSCRHLMVGEFTVPVSCVHCCDRISLLRNRLIILRPND